MAPEKKVAQPKTGVNLFRIQGTRGWAFDHRESNPMPLEEDCVKTGFLHIDASRMLHFVHGRCLMIALTGHSERTISSQLM
jgi:hypothetical protein